MRKSTLKALSTALVLIMILSVVSVNVFAANSPDVTLIKEVSIYGVHTPYAGYRPDYAGKLGSSAYTYSNQLDNDADVYNGKWWYDETSQKVVNPSSTFIEGHIYTFTILLTANKGYEFRVDNENTPFISATVNGQPAVVYDDLTNKYQAFVEYTFDPCEYNYEISKIEVNVEEPEAGVYPKFDAEILTPGVSKDEPESPYYIESVAWYDCVNQTFLDPSHTFKEDGIYEVNIMLTTIGDYYFSTEDDKTDVNVLINGKEGAAGTGGKNDKYHIRVSRIVYGDVREEVSYVEVTGVTSPSVGSYPDFDVTPANDKFYINGVYWTDITDKTSMKETDKFKIGHEYELQVWIRANEEYRFSLDKDGYIDIAALVGGLQADVLLPGSEISAELSVIYTPSTENVISFVNVTEVDVPIAGEKPDYDAFCTTEGSNISKVEWYDVTDEKSVIMTENDTFKEGRKYKVIVSVNTEGNHTYELDDIGANIAEGNINGQKATAYSSYDDSLLELGLEFSVCAEKPDTTNPTAPSVPSTNDEPNSTVPSTPSESTEPTTPDETEPSSPSEPEPSVPASDKGTLGDVNGDSKVNIKDVTEIQKFAAKLIDLTDAEKLRADVNADTKINIKDATAIQKYIAKIETGLPIGEPIK